MAYTLHADDFLSDESRTLTAVERLCLLGLKMLSNCAGEVDFSPHEVCAAVFPAGDVSLEGLLATRDALIDKGFAEKSEKAGVFARVPALKSNDPTASVEGDPLAINNVGIEIKEADAQAYASQGLVIPLKGKGVSALLTHANVSVFQSKYPQINVKRELEELIRWNNDYPEKRKTTKGVFRHINNWLQRANKQAERRQGSSFSPDSRRTSIMPKQMPVAGQSVAARQAAASKLTQLRNGGAKAATVLAFRVPA